MNYKWKGEIKKDEIENETEAKRASLKEGIKNEAETKHLIIESSELRLSYRWKKEKINDIERKQWKQ